MAVLFSNIPGEIREPQKVETVCGKLPDDFPSGTFFFNGAGALDVKHWFDGDGAVHALRLQASQIDYQVRYVQTRGKQLEDRWKRKLLGAIGSVPYLGTLGAILWGTKNPANTSVIPFKTDELLALYEGGKPHRLDRYTLETLGEDNLNGALKHNQSFSAHAKKSVDGQWINFGISYGKEALLDVYKTDPLTGETTHQATCKMPIRGLTHDMALTDTHAFFIVSPCTLPTLPLGMLLGLQTTLENLRWTPEQGTYIGVYNLEERQMRWLRSPPFFSFHFAHAASTPQGWDLWACTYADSSFLNDSVNWVQHKPGAPKPGIVSRISLGANDQVNIDSYPDVTMEYPCGVQDSRAPQRYIYSLTYKAATGIAGDLARFDCITKAFDVVHQEAHLYANEPVVLEHFLLSTVRDTLTQETFLHIYETESWGSAPVYVGKLPQNVPYAFHGYFEEDFSAALDRKLAMGDD